MFLIRTAFWLSVLVMLLPADKETGDQAPRVTAFQALSAAQSTVADLSQFCNRNPDVCTTGGAAFHVFADKARFGAKMLYGYFSKRDDNSAVENASGTLSPDDKKPAWHTPDKPKTGAI